jgi:hypothetical protein
MRQLARCESRSSAGFAGATILGGRAPEGARKLPNRVAATRDDGPHRLMFGFDRGLCPRNRLWGMLERGAKAPFERIPGGRSRKGRAVPRRGSSRGVMTDREGCQQVGGELLAYVW